MKNKVNEEKEMYMVFISRRMMCLIFLIIQSIFLVYIVIRGTEGYASLLKVRHTNKVLEQECKKYVQEIQNLELQVKEWKTSLFLHEKYAREKLHMGKKDETVFFYTE